MINDQMRKMTFFQGVQAVDLKETNTKAGSEEISFSPDGVYKPPMFRSMVGDDDDSDSDTSIKVLSNVNSGEGRSRSGSMAGLSRNSSNRSSKLTGKMQGAFR